MNMILNETSAQQAAEYLLQIKAIKLEPQNPFTWTSGILSPIYCDNRKTLSYPNVRTFIRQEFCKLIADQFGTAENIAGVATGGIAQGALVAQELGLPFSYVRSKAKGHGLQNLVEGVIEDGASVVVIEDLISTGKSSLAAVKALREAGANVKGVLAIFSYGFESAEKAFANHDCPLHTLTNYNHLMGVALEKKYINESELESLQNWRVSPKTWKP